MMLNKKANKLKALQNIMMLDVYNNVKFHADENKIVLITSPHKEILSENLISELISLSIYNDEKVLFWDTLGHIKRLQSLNEIRQSEFEQNQFDLIKNSGYDWIFVYMPNYRQNSQILTVLKSIPQILIIVESERTSKKELAELMEPINSLNIKAVGAVVIDSDIK
ncbi:hypothetical protein [Weissella cibaria]|uniref:hypothetical protein n=1 Tax=Weissella cibaria TaxID=137591 RepID=UPI000BFFE3E5|nr:hypothetical protein [Weissella cibaria]